MQYRDGLQASIVNLNSKTRDYLFAARVKGSPGPQATCFYIGLYTHAHWGFLVRAFEELVLTGREQMPVERTLLANGIMLAGLESRQAVQKRWRRRSAGSRDERWGKPDEQNEGEG